MPRWLDEKRREAFYKQAKREGYRARSAYKLKQLDARFRLLRKGAVAVDLGCSPGGWTQVLVESVAPGGRVVGVDLLPTTPIEGAVLVQGDFTSVEVQAEVQHAAGAKIDVVVSDMSPNISGVYDRDQAQSVWLASHAAAFAEAHLATGGRFVVKVFEGADYDEFVSGLRPQYRQVRFFRPPASRKRSSEVYVVGLDRAR